MRFGLSTIPGMSMIKSIEPKVSIGCALMYPAAEMGEKKL